MDGERRGDGDADASRGLPVGPLARDVGSAVLAVFLVGLFLFAVSGVWPPLVAIESPSMTPNIETGDMVLVMEAERFPGPGAVHGIVTAAAGARTGHTTFGRPGDVIVFAPDGDRDRTPVIHRAMLWVDDGENWYDRADPEAVGGAADCAALRNCPAPHAGFVTQGDFNREYDQTGTTSGVVRPEWVIGTGELRLPNLGWVRLRAQAASGSLGSGESEPAHPAGAGNATLGVVTTEG